MLRRMLWRRTLRVEEFRKGIEVLLDQCFQQFLDDFDALPQIARNRKPDFVERWQFGGDDAFHMLEKKIKELDALAGRGRGFAQQEQLLMHFLGIARAGSAMGDREPLQDGLGFAVDGWRRGKVQIVGHIRHSE